MRQTVRWLTWTALPGITVAALAREAFACPLCGDSPGPGTSAATGGGGELLVIAGLVAAGLIIARGARWLRNAKWKRIERAAMEKTKEMNPR